MARAIARLPDLVIVGGATLSNILQGVALDDAVSLVLGLLSGDSAKTYFIQWSQDPKATNDSAWFNWHDGGAYVTAPNIIAIASVYPWIGAGSIRLGASSAAASTTTWKVSKIWET